MHSSNGILTRPFLHLRDLKTEHRRYITLANVELQNIHARCIGIDKIARWLNSSTSIKRDEERDG